MDLECIVIGTCCLYSHIGRHLDNIYAFEIWHEMILLFGNFHDSLKLSWKHSSVMAWIYFSWCCALMKCISWRWLSQNTKFSRNSFHDGDSHEMFNSHEINSWRLPLMKYHQKPSWKYLCKSGGNFIFMRVTLTNSRQENYPWRPTLMKMRFSCVYYRESFCVTVYPHELFSWE